MSDMTMNSIHYKYPYEQAMNLVRFTSNTSFKIHNDYCSPKDLITLDLFKNQEGEKKGGYYMFRHVILVLKNYWTNM